MAVLVLFPPEGNVGSKKYAYLARRMFWTTAKAATMSRTTTAALSFMMVFE
jgi:hypothetical protein